MTSFSCVETFHECPGVYSNFTDRALNRDMSQDEVVLLSLLFGC